MPEKTNYTFGPKLQEIRESRGLSREDLHKRVGKSVSWIASIENRSQRAPALKVCEALSEALGCDLDELWSLAASDRLRASDPDIFQWHETQVAKALGKQVSPALASIAASLESTGMNLAPGDPAEGRRRVEALLSGFSFVFMMEAGDEWIDVSRMVNEALIDFMPSGEVDAVAKEAETFDATRSWMKTWAIEAEDVVGRFRMKRRNALAMLILDWQRHARGALVEDFLIAIRRSRRTRMIRHISRSFAWRKNDPLQSRVEAVVDAVASVGDRIVDPALSSRVLTVASVLTSHDGLNRERLRMLLEAEYDALKNGTPSTLEPKQSREGDDHAE